MKFMSKSDFHTYGSKFNLELNCMSGFFKKLKLHKLLWQVQINLKFNETINSINMEKLLWRKCWKIFLEAIFCIRENFF